MKSELLHWEKPKLVGVALEELANKIVARATSCWGVYSMGCPGF